MQFVDDVWGSEQSVRIHERRSDVSASSAGTVDFNNLNSIHPINVLPRDK